MCSIAGRWWWTTLEAPFLFGREVQLQRSSYHMALRNEWCDGAKAYMPWYLTGVHRIGFLVWLLLCTVYAHYLHASYTAICISGKNKCPACIPCKWICMKAFWNKLLVLIQASLLQCFSGTCSQVIGLWDILPRFTSYNMPDMVNSIDREWSLSICAPVTRCCVPQLNKTWSWTYVHQRRSTKKTAADWSSSFFISLDVDTLLPRKHQFSCWPSTAVGAHYEHCNIHDSNHILVSSSTIDIRIAAYDACFMQYLDIERLSTQPHQRQACIVFVQASLESLHVHATPSLPLFRAQGNRQHKTGSFIRQLPWCGHCNSPYKMKN